jgi:hypothetical protein
MRFLLLAGSLSVLACTGTVSAPFEPIAAKAPGASPGGAPGGTQGQGAVGSLPVVYRAAGIRRLSQKEVEVATAAVLGIPSTDLATAMGTDVRQGGFTRNSDQRVSSVQADALWQSAQALARQAVSQSLATLAPCATANGSETCASAFITRFASQAFRRPVTPAEQAGLLTVYRAGRDGATYAAGIELVIAAVLQSASFLYVTELGTEPTSDGLVQLTGEEIATSLSLLLTGVPADKTLLEAGRAGALNDPAERVKAARSMLDTPRARAQIERLILEWQGSDTVDSAPKDTGLFPEWAGVRNDVLSESRAIINSVMFTGDGTLKSLLSTPDTTLTPALARFYNVTGSGKVTQPSYRRGLLLAGGFSAANSHPNNTAPVKRGAVVRKKLLCQQLPFPTGVGVSIVVPPADPTKTTRERFAAHSANPSCAGCHDLLDPIGFAFESFDAIGRYRATENRKPIDPSGELVGAGDANGKFSDAAGLASLLANSQSVSECFQRQLYRFASGHSNDDEEQGFVNLVKDRPSGREGKVVELLVDYIQSDAFIRRTR